MNEIQSTCIRPILDRVLVKRDEPAKMSAGGIHLVHGVSTAEAVRAGSSEMYKRMMKVGKTRERDYELEGVVVAVGPGGFDKKGNRKPMSVRPGERVVFLDDGEDIDALHVMIPEGCITGVRE